MKKPAVPTNENARQEESNSLRTLDTINEKEYEFQELLLQISTEFINIPIESLEETISKSLEKMGQFVEADRAYIFDYLFEEGICRNTHEWCEEGVSPEIENLQDVRLKWIPQWVEAHEGGAPFYVPNVQDLEDDGEGGLKDILEPQGIKSLITVPMRSDGQLIGFVGFDSVRNYHFYSESEKKLLVLFSEMLVNIRNRISQVERLKYHERMIKAISTSATELLSNCNQYSAIKNSLELLAKSVDCDQAFYFSLTNENGNRLCSHQIEVFPDGRPAIFAIQELQKLPIDDFKEVGKKILAGEVFQGHVQELPDGSPLQMIMKKQGVLSYLFIPVMFESDVHSFLGFETTEKQRVWNETELQLLKGFAGNIGIAIHRKELEDELIEAKNEADSANRAKSEFLAKMSHEIRTPLNGVLGFLDLLSQSNLVEDQKRYVSNASLSGKSLLAIINDILDFSKIEAGKMELEQLPVHLGQLASDAARVVEVKARNKNLDLKVSVEEEFPLVAMADPVRLKQILLNLLSNAVKFTDSGQVELRLSCEKRDERVASYRFEVLDTGIGMTQEQIFRLFQPFTQADNSTTRLYGGSGLGLVISNRLVEKMQSHIEVESEPGKGSKFSFRIEMEIAPDGSYDLDKTIVTTADEFKLSLSVHEDDQETEAPSDRSDSKVDTVDNEPPVILLVEDVSINRLLVRSMLKGFLPEATIIEAENGEQAVKLCREEQPSLILMDVHMPVMDGLTATREIRGLSCGNSSVSIVALTAAVLEEDKQKCLEAGMNGFLMKPIESETLKEMVLHALKSQVKK